jgi:hypothetical protein
MRPNDFSKKFCGTFDRERLPPWYERVNGPARPVPHTNNVWFISVFERADDVPGRSHTLSLSRSAGLVNEEAGQTRASQLHVSRLVLNNPP